MLIEGPSASPGAASSPGSEPVGMLAGIDAPGPRYRDREESRFYQAGGLSPDRPGRLAETPRAVSAAG